VSARPSKKFLDNIRLFKRMSFYSIRNFVKELPVNLRKKLPVEIKLIEIPTAESRKLNKIYRGKNKPTNVLSFKYSRDYGEILLCPAVIKKEAKSQGNTYKYQFTWMVLHGMIHLAGVHHEESQYSAIRAARLEQKILIKIFGSLKS